VSLGIAMPGLHVSSSLKTVCEKISLIQRNYRSLTFSAYLKKVAQKNKRLKV
jgi:hypothetical protein